MMQALIKQPQDRHIWMFSITEMANVKSDVNFSSIVENTAIAILNTTLHTYNIITVCNY